MIMKKVVFLLCLMSFKSVFSQDVSLDREVERVFKDLIPNCLANSETFQFHFFSQVAWSLLVRCLKLSGI